MADVTTKTGVVNLGFTAIGEAPVADVDADDNKRARTAARVYETVRDTLLKKYPWRHAIRRRSFFEVTDSQAGRATATDFFDDASIDASLWNETDAGSNIVEQNGRIEGTGDGNWDTNGLVTVTQRSLIKNRVWTFKVTVPISAKEAVFGPSASSTLDQDNANALGVYFRNTGALDVYVNGVVSTTGQTYKAGLQYIVQVRYTEPGWVVYVQSDEDIAYKSNIKILETSTDSTGPMYFQANFFSSGGATYFDEYREMQPFTPEFQYCFSYSVPADSLRIINFYPWRFTGSVGFGTGTGIAATGLARGDGWTVEKGLILTNFSEFGIRYIQKLTTISEWPAEFKAVLGADIARTVVVDLAGDTRKAQLAEGKYDLAIKEAYRMDAIEDTVREDFGENSEWVLAGHGISDINDRDFQNARLGRQTT